MNVRRKLVLAACLALAAPLARAQKAAQIRRVGILAVNPRPSVGSLYDVFAEGLRELGYAEGRNLVIEYRSAQGRPERLPEAAADLVRAKVELIVTSVNATSAAAKAAAQSIPIVMIVGTDVVAQGLAASLARPGGSITGLTWDVGLEIVAKRFELLKEAVPKATRIAVLWDPGQDAPGFKRVIEQGGAAVGATLIWPEVADEIEAGFEMAVRERAQALFTGGGARLFRLRKRVVELAAKHRLPDTHYTAEFVEAGGLMSYAPNLPDMFRRAATYVDRILRGAKPGDLPIEQPARLDLVINLRTAKALGLKLPQSLLIRADRVIE